MEAIVIYNVILAVARHYFCFILWVTCFPLVFGILSLSLEPQYAYLNRSNSDCIVPSSGETIGLTVHEYHPAEVTGPSSQKS